MDRGWSVGITGITAVNDVKAVSGKIRNAAFFNYPHKDCPVRIAWEGLVSIKGQPRMSCPETVGPERFL